VLTALATEAPLPYPVRNYMRASGPIYRRAIGANRATASMALGTHSLRFVESFSSPLWLQAMGHPHENDPWPAASESLTFYDVPDILRGLRGLVIIAAAYFQRNFGHPQVGDTNYQ